MERFDCIDCNLDAAWNDSDRSCTLPIQYGDAGTGAGKHVERVSGKIHVELRVLCAGSGIQANGFILRPGHVRIPPRSMSLS